jgi:putative toxin-antitoxin system antitoxin component (TIGR02293 family)
MPAKLAAPLDAARATRLVEAGLDWKEAEFLAKELGVSLAELANYLGISQPTFFRRKKQKRFPLSESDHIMRFARLWSLAEDVFENADGARQWLKERQLGLQGRIPLDVAKSEAGAREVEALLQRIEYGLPA